jgi:hypothetical protein
MCKWSFWPLVGITILKHSAYQNQVSQELLMAAMLLMNEDIMVNEDPMNMISTKIGSNWPSSFI